MKVRL
jgi:hypothetical protein